MSKPKKFKNGIDPKSVKIIAICGNKKYKFNSLSDAERNSLVFDKKVFTGAISKVCQGKLKSHGKINGKKVYWKYYNKESS